MNDKFNQFYAWVIGQKPEISDPTNLFQCMDLAYLATFFLNFPKDTIQHAFAYQVFTQPNSSTLKYFDIIPNSSTFIPQAFDLAVFDKTANNIAGHLSVCNGKGDTKTFESVDENWASNGLVTLVTHNYVSPKLLGVLRPKTAASPSVIVSELAAKIDLTGLETALTLRREENYGIIELQALKAKLQAKDQVIADNETQVELPTTESNVNPPINPPVSEPTPQIPFWVKLWNGIKSLFQK